MTATKAKKTLTPAELLASVIEQGYMVYIGGAGKVRTSPALPADLHEQFTLNNSEIKAIIRPSQGVE